jgi:hypothetical protein
MLDFIRDAIEVGLIGIGLMIAGAFAVALAPLIALIILIASE